jgi:hypothetical protein
MAYGAVTLPLTGAGDATAAPACDVIGGNAYQAMKLIDGLEGSTEPVRAKGTTPGSTDHALVTRPIGSTAFSQAVILSSQHTVTVGNPTTAVNVANPTTSVTVTNPATAVEANLTSEGGTKVIGIVQGVPFTSGAITRSTLNSSAEGQLFAANANRDYVMITNMATAVTLFVGLSTSAVSTLGANAHFVIPPLQTYTLGGQLGNGPRYLGPIRCRINSTTIAGPVIGVEFST